MSSYRKFNPPPHEFHPEFGYLCPTRQLRHSVRVALAAAAFGLITGAVGAVVLLFPGPGRDLALIEPARAESVGGAIRPAAAVAAAAGPQRIAVEAISTVGIAERSPPATAPRPTPVATKAGDAASSSPAGPHQRCKEETWPYFDSKCLWGSGRRDRNEPLPADTPAPAAALVTVAAGAPATNPSAPRQAVLKKKPKTVISAARRKEVQEPPNPGSVYASPAYASPAYASPAYASPYGHWRQDDGARDRRPEWGGWSW